MLPGVGWGAWGGRCPSRSDFSVRFPQGAFLREPWLVSQIPAEMDPKGSPFLPSPLWELMRSMFKCGESGQLRPKEHPCGPQCSPSRDLSGPLFFLCEMGVLIPTFLKHKDERSDMQSAWHGVGLHQCHSQRIIFRACEGEGSRPQPGDHPAV